MSDAAMDELSEEDRRHEERRARWRKQRREVGVMLVVAAVWTGLFAAILVLTNSAPGRDAAALPWLLALGAFSWLGASHFVTRREMRLPASMLGLLGPITFGFAATHATPETRALSGIDAVTVNYAVAATLMLVFLFRFRLAKLISPVSLFSIVALFLVLKGLTREGLAHVEGLTPRGVIAALLDIPWVVALFTTLSAASVIGARYLDRHGEEFGMEAAKPLHIIGGSVLALIAAKFAYQLPAFFDIAAIVAIFAIVMAWSLRIDRMAVMLTSAVAMTRPLVLSVAEINGAEITLREWSGWYCVIMAGCQIVWLLIRRHTYRAGWTQKPRNIRWDWSDPVRWSRRRRKRT